MKFLHSKFALALLLLSGAVATAAPPPPLFNQGERVLFQGDSITDGGRGRTADPNHILGQDYAYIIAARQGAAYPEKNLTFFNRGVSGNKVTDLAARWKADTLDLHPTVLSVMIGVNDVNSAEAVDAYEETYDRLLAAVVAANPKVKLILCEPFLAHGSRADTGFDAREAKMKSVQGIVEKLAAKYHAPVVYFQRVFDEAFKRAPVGYWIWDGVHPTYSGHELMADEWERVYREFYGAPAQ